MLWHGMTTAPPAKIDTQHTLFEAQYASARGQVLHQAPFAAHQALLTHPADYGATQALGSALRAAGIEAFEFIASGLPWPEARCTPIHPRDMATRT